MTFKKRRPLTEEFFHCTGCRRDLVGKEFDKQPLGYEQVEGKLVPHKSRFSVFCSTCGDYLCTIDPEASAIIASKLSPKK